MNVEADLAARYGTSRRSVGLRLVVATLIVGYLGVAAWAAWSLSQGSVEGNVLGWRARPAK